jgi:hypothetical protein
VLATNAFAAHGTSAALPNPVWYSYLISS